MRQLVAFLFILTLSACQTPTTEQDKFSWQDASVIELQNAMTNGDLSAEQLTQYYLQRINTHNRQGANLRAVNSVNENALTDARRLDAEREQGKIRGPLHGIPVLLKDNVDTADGMANTGVHYCSQKTTRKMMLFL